MTFKDFWKGGFKKSATPRVFAMIRNEDESGHSGVGHVLDGIVFPSGKVVVCWNPDNANVKVGDKNVNSISVFDSWEAFNAIHIGQHPTNRTEIKFLN